MGRVGFAYLNFGYGKSMVPHLIQEFLINIRGFEPQSGGENSLTILRLFPNPRCSVEAVVVGGSSQIRANCKLRPKPNRIDF